MKQPSGETMKRLMAALSAGLITVGLVATPALAADPGDYEIGDIEQASDKSPNKIDVMGMWAHPDDDANFETPCGIWQDQHDIRCGIIMVTRGEGGSNSVGDEAGPDLGLRRESEDRTSHIRSKTADIFNLDRVDFYYNTSAPLTAEIWDQEETLARAVRVVRETRPEVMTSWTPSLAAGHGNHQDADRLMWETIRAAADPSKFPDQLTGTDAVKPWQVKRVLENAPDKKLGESQNSKNCMASAQPDPDIPYPVVGLWTGYDSPYKWPKGNVQGQKAGTSKTWAQAGSEAAKAHATQARKLVREVEKPSCMKWTVPWSIAPLQPETSKQGRNDNSALYGATLEDPGGMPLGSTFFATTENYRVGQGQQFTVTVNIASGKGELPGGEISLDAPDGWEVSDAQQITGVGEKTRKLEFTVDTASDAKLSEARIGLKFKGKSISAYNEVPVKVVPTVEGRFARWGNTQEYEKWASDQQVWSGGSAPAIDRIGAGESRTLEVEVTNRGTQPASGTSTIELPDGLEAQEESQSFTDVAPDETAKLEFTVTHTDPDAAGGETVPVKLSTRTEGAQSQAAVSESAEELDLYVVPTAVIPELSKAPSMRGDGHDFGKEIDVSRVWEGDKCDADGVDCGKGSVARVGWHGDDLYAYINVIDDKASAAATPERCFGHWLVDSAEILIDPSGASEDTSSTFKLGVFPFTDDPNNTNGNGADGPCWERDADNHQGFSTGPLAEKVKDAPNAPGVEVVADAERDGEGRYRDGAWNVKVKIPLQDMPAKTGPTGHVPTGKLDSNTVNPEFVGFNITPYDSDTQDFVGQTRLAWSPFGSQQSEPYRWGHMYLDGYQGNGKPEEAKAPIIPDTALASTQSPQSIYQSAARGTTVAGLNPTAAVQVSDAAFDGRTASFNVKSTNGADGAVHAYLWQKDPKAIPIWKTSCEDDPYGLGVCASNSDDTAVKWQPDMHGRVLAKASGSVSDGSLTLNLDKKLDRDALPDDVLLLISYEGSDTTSTSGGVDAWSIPFTAAEDGGSDNGGGNGDDGDGDNGQSPGDNEGGSSDGANGASSTDSAAGDQSHGEPLAITGQHAGPMTLAAVIMLVLGGALLALQRRQK
jgi:LmbE family N-acetylglucosaminyl deacetylase